MVPKDKLWSTGTTHIQAMAHSANNTAYKQQNTSKQIVGIQHRAQAVPTTKAQSTNNKHI